MIFVAYDAQFDFITWRHLHRFELVAFDSHFAINFELTGSWINDSSLVVLLLKIPSRSSIERVVLLPAKHHFATAIAVSWQTLRVQYYCRSAPFKNIGLPVSDLQRILFLSSLVYKD